MKTLLFQYDGHHIKREVVYRYYIDFTAEMSASGHDVHTTFWRWNADKQRVEWQMIADGQRWWINDEDVTPLYKQYISKILTGEI